MNYPGHSLTLIVKGTFDLKPGAPAVPAEEQPAPTGPEDWPGDDEQAKSPRYESDFAWFKPHADLLLVGAAYAPGGTLTTLCPVTFQVGARSKTLAVFGDRRWERHFLSSRATDPVPFTRKELRYEHSFGGKGSTANPVGQGLGEVPDDQGNPVCLLPNIEDPAHPIVSRGERPAPAGFGPLGPDWSPRREKLGTYKGAYRKTRWPWFPEDLDWSHFNAAPADQQLEGYLRGDEPLRFENLHAKHARYECRLPGLRMRAFLETQPPSGTEAAKFAEVTLNLDTLWVDLEAEKLVLVWRGWAPVASEDFDEVQQMCLLSEPLDRAPAPVGTCRQIFRDHEAAEAQAAEPEAPPPEVETVPPRPATPSPEELAAAQQAKAAADAALAQKIDLQTNLLCAQLGVDITNLPPELKQQLAAKQRQMIQQVTGEGQAEAGSGETRAELNAALSKLGIDPDHPPPLSPKAQTEQLRFLREMGIEDPGSTAKEFEEFWVTMAAILPRVGLDPENLGPLIEQAKKLSPNLGGATSPKPPPPAATPPGPPTPDTVQAPLGAGDSLEGADLSHLDFSGRNLTEADFSGANLTGAKFRKTILQRANFSHAILTGADFTGADLTMANAADADFSGATARQAILKSADLAGAKFAKADLSEARLDEAVFEAADLSGARLTGSSAKGTLFVKANLTGVSAQKLAAREADFSKATLSDADLADADLAEASLDTATGQRANFNRSVMTKAVCGAGDFAGAKFAQIQANGSVWKAANLTGADLRHAQLEDALFTSARLAQADCSAANLKFARLNKADLSQARMLRLNLFQGSLEKANLTQTDLSGSNLYEVELLDAVFDRTVADGANLKMTKLDPP